METATLDMATKILSVFKNGSREQVQALLASGLLADLRDANFSEPIDRDAVRKLLGLNPLNPPLLKLIGTVRVPATVERFVAGEKFVVNTAAGAPVRISFLGSNVREWFGGKTEEPAVEAELRYAEFTRPSVDGPILAELGDKAEITLAQIYALMARQPNGEEGVLLTNGWANIFYVRDANGKLRAVRVGWDGVGWRVDAYSIEDPVRWRDECRMFSRDS